MKVILSRKGFDSAAGGIPSPILGKQLISLPIPRAYSGDDYRNLSFTHQGEHFNYAKLLKDLNVNFYSECHLDPDLIRGVKSRAGAWQPALGQAGNAAAEILEVEVGDLFLFFGNFRQAVFSNGRFHFLKDSPEMHVIWGYLKVTEIYDQAQIESGEIPQALQYHPHVREADFHQKNHNLVFASTEENSGIFEFSEKHILSDLNQKSYKKSYWNALPFLAPQTNRIKKVKKGLWNSGGRGQEFICKIKKRKQFDAWLNQLHKPSKI